MNRNFLLMAACLVAGNVFVSCDKDDEGGETGSGKARMVAAIDMAPTANNGYVIPIQDLSVGTASFRNGYEIKSSNHLVKYKDWIFVVEGASGADIRKFVRNEDGSLSEAGSLTVDNVGYGAAHALVVSETKAYATAMVSNKIVIFNPSTMQKTGEIDISDPRWVASGANTSNPIGMFLRDGILYVGLGQFVQMPTGVKGAYVLLIDESTDEPIKMISDERLTSATAIGVGGMFLDENNDLYVPCWGSYGFDPAHHSGLLRIKNGKTDFDEDYCFDLSAATFEGVEGGKLQYVMTYHYFGNGEVYFFGYCPAFATTPDFVNDKTNYSFKGNIYDRTAKVLGLPRTNAYSCAINHLGNRILFGLTTDANGVGLFSYDRESGACSTSPVLNIQGTVMNLQVFD